MTAHHSQVYPLVMCVCPYMCGHPERLEKEALHLESQGVVGHLVWGLASEHGCSVRAGYALNH